MTAEFVATDMLQVTTTTRPTPLIQDLIQSVGPLNPKYEILTDFIKRAAAVRQIFNSLYPNLDRSFMLEIDSHFHNFLVQQAEVLVNPYHGEGTFLISETPEILIRYNPLDPQTYAYRVEYMQIMINQWCLGTREDVAQYALRVADAALKNRGLADYPTSDKC
jgi:hypothetical protein